MVRLEGKIIGYAVYFVRRNMHYRTHIWATADLFWVHPDHRSLGVGNALFAFVEAALTERGVNVMHTTIKEEHPAAGFLLTARGHDKIEAGYSKRLR
jgi:GNAT superfamily N-acetyltransferase